MSYRIISLVLLSAFFGFSCKQSTEKPAEETKEETVAKTLPNIILIIGDGTGLSQISSLWYFGDEKPNYERFEYVGLSKTNSASDKITDSGAGATAFAIGEKSYNGSIGVTKDSLAKENITEILSKKGYNTGVVATSSITHATPASFYAHVKSRHDQEKIAEQLWSSEIDFFAGGGIKFFNHRADKADGLQQLRDNGFAVDTSAIETPLSGNKIGYLLASDGMPRVTEANPDFLLHAANKAINHLNGLGAPFFLMIEGSQVDWGGHANDGEYVVTELQELDKVVGAALDFAAANGNTLVVALADHETGGFALSPQVVQGFGKEQDDYNHINIKFTTGGHTAAHIPVFASGVGAQHFTGIFENNTIFDKLLQVVATGN
ncbi:alkaline phosphatase [bacterium]|nr:alkaline phosphatase [bacterium]